MLVVFVKSLIVLLLVWAIVRLMGKRQIGEMQPFELVITLIIAEVACIPMNDPYIPIYSGLLPIITLGVVEVLLSFVSRKSMIFRQFMSGSSVIAIDKKGIRYDNLKKLNITIDDLIESVRTSGYPDLSEIEYAIYETSGKLCVIPKSGGDAGAFLPLPILIDGKFVARTMNVAGVTEPQVIAELVRHGQSPRDIALVDIRQDGTIYVSPKRAECFTAKLSITGAANW